MGCRHKCNTILHSTATNTETGIRIKLPNNETEQIPPNLLTSFVVDAVKLWTSPVAISALISAVLNSLFALRQRDLCLPSFAVIFCHALCSSSSTALFLLTLYSFSRGGPHRVILCVSTKSDTRVVAYYHIVAGSTISFCMIMHDSVSILQ